MRILKKINLLIIFILCFFSISINVKAISCGSGFETVKIETPGTCAVQAKSTSTVPSFLYNCTKDNTNQKFAYMSDIFLYEGKGTTGKRINIEKVNSKCLYGGVIQPKEALKENQTYTISYVYKFTDVANNQYDSISKPITKSFKTNSSASTKAPAECTISIPNEQVSVNSFVAKYKCSNGASPSKYIVTSDKTEIKSKSLKKDSGTITIKDLKAGTKYKITLKYTYKDNKKEISASNSTKKSEDPFLDQQGANDPLNADGSDNTRASQAKLEANQKEYDPSNGATTCSNLSVKDLIDEYWRIVVMILPAALILLTSVDFLKAIVSGNDDQIKKSSNAALKRTLAAVVLLMLPYFLSLLLGWFGIELCI